MEEILPPQTRSGAGFELTRVTQFTIFLENRVGKLGSLVRTLEESSVRVMAIAIEESADAALVRLICGDEEHAKATMSEAGFTFTQSDVLAVEMPRESTTPLIDICSALLAAEINIHYAYPLLVRPRGPALALYVEDPTLAAQILIRKDYTLLSQNDLRL